MKSSGDEMKGIRKNKPDGRQQMGGSKQQGENAWRIPAAAIHPCIQGVNHHTKSNQWPGLAWPPPSSCQGNFISFLDPFQRVPVTLGREGRGKGRKEAVRSKRAAESKDRLVVRFDRATGAGARLPS